jgi:DNA (cytosine-5)-methyltransferase 1
LRPRVVLVAFRDSIPDAFQWPSPIPGLPPTVGEVLCDLMGARGWTGVSTRRLRANSIAPTLVGGSKKHGGPDLGPTRAKRQWAALGVDGHGLANEAPGPDQPVDFAPRLTVQMTGRIQSFPDAWRIIGGKTAAYRQIGNAFPPPFAKAVGQAVRAAILKKKSVPRRSLVQIPLFKTRGRPQITSK